MSHINLIARDLFKRIAQQQWHRLGKRHKLRLDKGEVGITEDIIYELVRFCKHNPGCGLEVWKSKDESVNGHDIDLFIREFSGSGYYWFPLQAKVLDQRQQYAHIAPGGKGGQWPLLQRLQQASLSHGIFCQPYYLWYTGFCSPTITTYMERWYAKSASERKADLNLQLPDVTPVWRAAFGCSLTPADVVQAVCNTHPQPWYHHFHNTTAVQRGITIPWHAIFKYSFARNLPSGSQGRGFTTAELQGRLQFYKRTIQPFAPTKPKRITNYYYYASEQGLGDSPELMGRYALLIDRVEFLRSMQDAWPGIDKDPHSA